MPRRLTKTGQIHKHSLNIQDIPGQTFVSDAHRDAHRMRICAKVALGSLSANFERYRALTGRDTMARAHALVGRLITELDAAIERETGDGYSGVTVADYGEDDQNA